MTQAPAAARSVAPDATPPASARPIVTVNPR